MDRGELHLGKNKEVFDAELYAPYQAVKTSEEFPPPFFSRS